MRGSRPFPLLDAYAYALEYFQVAIVIPDAGRRLGTARSREAARREARARPRVLDEPQELLPRLRELRYEGG